MLRQNVKPNMGNAQVKLNTGKRWDEWTALLDEWGGENKTVLAINRYLIQHFGLSHFWAQMIAVDYKWTHWTVGGGFQPALVSDKIIKKANAIAHK